MIKVKYTAQLKKTAGTGEEQIEINDSIGLTELLQTLCGKHDDRFHKMLFNEDGRFSNSVVLVLNGRQIRLEENPVLSDGDELLLLSPIAGGNMARLTSKEKAVYAWQLTVPGFGERGQEKLKSASVLISRIGGLGGVVAYELAAAGVGHLILAHGGNVKESDLNRQLLMTDDWLGKPRVESAEKRLKELNPRLKITAVNENINEQNARAIVSEADIIVDCAPLFEERYLMNREAVAQNKPLVDCAMYELEAQITTIIPGKTACLSCLYPQKPDFWKREFPVFGAVSGTVGCLGAMEAVKVISGLGEPLTNRLLTMDLRDMSFHTIHIQKREACPVCGNKAG